MSAVIAFALPFMLKPIQKPMSNAKKTHHIIQLVTISAELKQPELPIMYCSRPLGETAVHHLIKSSVAVFTLQVNNDGFLPMQRLIHIAQVSRMLQILRGRMSLHAYCQKQNRLPERDWGCAISAPPDQVYDTSRVAWANR